MTKKRLLDLTKEQLGEAIEQLGEKKFRTKQVIAWLSKGKLISEMTNLSKSFRDKLSADYTEGYLAIQEELVSKDGTRKYLLRLDDGSLIEAVLMEYEYGKTLCISTEVGCPMGCRFCASAIGGLKRNMTAGELLGEVLTINRTLGEDRQIRNLVLMGTGEPFANYDNVVSFLKLIHDDDYFGMSYRNISLSTCGLTDKILQFADENIPVTLCLSLHSAIPEKRIQVMPVEKRYSLYSSVKAMEKYSVKSGRRIVYEYILIKGLNMGDEDVEALFSLIKGQNAHINLIPLNGTVGSYTAPTKKDVYRFLKKLTDMGLSATIRRSLGQDIEGACGQLRAKYIENSKESITEKEDTVFILDKGKVKEDNEDYAFSGYIEGIGKILAVADGMGGYRGGRLASHTVLKNIVELLKLNPDMKIEDAIFESNKLLLDIAEMDSSYKDLGTTLTLAVINSGKITVYHIGDSRCYLLKNKKLIQITKDHSYIQTLVDKGYLSKDEARLHPRRNELMMAMGMQELNIDIYEYDIDKDDILLLCSDGLYIYFSDEQLECILNSKRTIQEKANILLKGVMDGGAIDNISICLSDLNLLEDNNG